MRRQRRRVRAYDCERLALCLSNASNECGAQKLSTRLLNQRQSPSQLSATAVGPGKAPEHLRRQHSGRVQEQPDVPQHDAVPAGLQRAEQKVRTTTPLHPAKVCAFAFKCRLLCNENKLSPELGCTGAKRCFRQRWRRPTGPLWRRCACTFCAPGMATCKHTHDSREVRRAGSKALWLEACLACARHLRPLRLRAERPLHLVRHLSAVQALGPCAVWPALPCEHRCSNACTRCPALQPCCLRTPGGTTSLGTAQPT